MSGSEEYENEMQRDCSECETGIAYGTSRRCDDCLGEMLIGRVRKFERLAREHRENGALNPNMRKLAFEGRKEMREMGVRP